MIKYEIQIDESYIFRIKLTYQNLYREYTSLAMVPNPNIVNIIKLYEYENLNYLSCYNL